MCFYPDRGERVKNVPLSSFMSMGHVSIRKLNEGCFHRGRYQAVCHFGARSQAAYLLGSQGFWSPINRGLPTFWATFWPFLLFGVFIFFSLPPAFCVFATLAVIYLPGVSSSLLVLLRASFVSAGGHFSRILVSRCSPVLASLFI